MSAPGSEHLLMMGGGDPLDELGRIDRSLRTRSSAGAYLSRVQAAGNQRTFVYSGWVKRSKLSALQGLFQGYYDTNNRSQILFSLTSDELSFSHHLAGVTTVISSVGLFRDPAAHVHLVVAVDTNQATAANRVLMFANGVPLALTGSYVAQNTNLFINGPHTHYVGNDGGAAGRTFDGYTSMVAVIGGYPAGVDAGNWAAQDFASMFGVRHPVTGQWRPRSKAAVKAVVDGGDANSFLLAFDDPTSTTTLCADASSKGNNFTAVNVSLTADSTYDSTLDSPTNNYAVLNRYSFSSTTGQHQGDLSVLETAGISFSMAVSSIGVGSGKWYAEFLRTNGLYSYIGVSKRAAATNGAYPGSQSDTYGYASSGEKYNNATPSAYGAAYTVGDVIGVLLDVDAGSVEFFKNGVSQGVAFSGLSGPLYFCCGGYHNGTFQAIHFANFGQRPIISGSTYYPGARGHFRYAPPAGCKALCTKNLQFPAIQNPRKHFDVVTRAGTGLPATVSGLKFSPSLVWMKVRNVVNNNGLFDVVRGATKALFSDSVSAEATYVNGLSAFSSDGYSFAGPDWNSAGHQMVDWLWKAGGAPVANNAGSIASQVSANPLAGFSIVSYTGNGLNSATIGHGLGVKPAMVIVKPVTAVGSWIVRHSSHTGNLAINLNSTAANLAADNGYPDLTDSNVITLTNGGTSVSNVNSSGVGYVALCFAEVPGFSKFGAYTGNASADGPYVECGFRPALVMVKRANGTSDWNIFDCERSPLNDGSDERLRANTSDAEVTAAYLDILSSGFKIRTNITEFNASGGSYIFMAFAESHFRYANAR